MRVHDWRPIGVTSKVIQVLRNRRLSRLVRVLHIKSTNCRDGVELRNIDTNRSKKKVGKIPFDRTHPEAELDKAWEGEKKEGIHA